MSLNRQAELKTIANDLDKYHGDVKKLTELQNYSDEFNLLELAMLQPHGFLTKHESFNIISYLVSIVSTDTAQTILSLLNKTPNVKQQSIDRSTYNKEIANRLFALMIALKPHVSIEELKTPLKNPDFKHFILNKVDTLNFLMLLVYRLINQDDFNYYADKKLSVVTYLIEPMKSDNLQLVASMITTLKMLLNPESLAGAYFFATPFTTDVQTTLETGLDNFIKVTKNNDLKKAAEELLVIVKNQLDISTESISESKSELSSIFDIVNLKLDILKNKNANMTQHDIDQAKLSIFQEYLGAVILGDHSTQPEVVTKTNNDIIEFICAHMTNHNMAPHLISRLEVLFNKESTLGAHFSTSALDPDILTKLNHKLSIFISEAEPVKNNKELEQAKSKAAVLLKSLSNLSNDNRSVSTSSFSLSAPANQPQPAHIARTTKKHTKT